jgi:hypothetical protein
VDLMSRGQWATRAKSNCKVSKESYVLSANSDEIVWRNGIGDTDVETIISSTATTLTTITQRSLHSSGRGEPPGTGWTYFMITPDRIQVSPSNRSPFLLVGCF